MTNINTNAAVALVCSFFLFAFVATAGITTMSYQHDHAQAVKAAEDAQENTRMYMDYLDSL